MVFSTVLDYFDLSFSPFFLEVLQKGSETDISLMGNYSDGWSLFVVVVCLSSLMGCWGNFFVSPIA